MSGHETGLKSVTDKYWILIEIDFTFWKILFPKKPVRSLWIIVERHLGRKSCHDIEGLKYEWVQNLTKYFYNQNKFG